MLNSFINQVAPGKVWHFLESPPVKPLTKTKVLGFAHVKLPRALPALCPYGGDGSFISLRLNFEQASKMLR